MNSLLFETGLYDFTRLSIEEDFLLIQYLQDKKPPEQIAWTRGLTVDEAEKIIKTAMKKVLLKSKEVPGTKIWFTEMKRKIFSLKRKKMFS